MLSVVLTYVLRCSLAIIVSALCALYAFSPFEYWKKRGVPQVKGKYPIISNILDLLLKPAPEIILDIYNAFPDERFVGSYVVHKPVLLIRDPELVECVLIKDFSHFHAKGHAGDPNEAQVTKNLENLEGEQWRALRTKLLPLFTSGKLKNMHSHIKQCVDLSMEFMKKFDDGRQFQVEDVVSRYTLIVLGCCAFGLSPGSISDSNSKFLTIGTIYLGVSMMRKFIFNIAPLIRPIIKFFKVRTLMTKEQEDFVINSVNSILDYRKKENIASHDFLHLLNELRIRDKEKVENKQISPNDPNIFDDASLYSSAVMFIVAGYASTSHTMSFLVYELAIHQDVQNRLFDEVRRVVDEHNNDISYEAVQEMVYMDQVISETQRLYPGAYTVSRVVAKEYRIPGSDVVLPVGMKVRIPIWALHRDPQYFPEPDEFRPERFDEKKNTIRKGVYLPFGDGPRMCIGIRFAKLQAKVWLASLVLRYKILRSEKTPLPLRLERDTITVAPKEGVWVATELRV